MALSRAHVIDHGPSLEEVAEALLDKTPDSDIDAARLLTFLIKDIDVVEMIEPDGYRREPDAPRSDFVIYGMASSGERVTVTCRGGKWTTIVYR